MSWAAAKALWRDTTPIRTELFGAERLEHHAETLAAADTVTDRPTRVPRLSRRLRDNVKVLLAAYRASAASLQRGQPVTPAAEWLLDNFHLVELQLRQISADLPPGYYRQLPKLGSGPFAGYPRVFGIAWAYVAHTDSLVTVPVLTRFVHAYQRVEPLTIGELWAVAITLRIVLVENMRRLSVQIIQAQGLRVAADALVDLVTGPAPVALHIAVAPYDEAPLPEIFAAQIARRLRGFDPAETPLHGWLEHRLRQQDTQIDDVVAHALQRQGASNVTMRNIVTSMRVISELDWAKFFEEVSLVDVRLRDGSDFAAMDFATRNSYRTAIEDLARGSGCDELEVTSTALELATSGPGPRERDPGHVLVGRGRPQIEAALGYVPPLGGRLFRQVGRVGLPGYLGAIGLVSVALLALILGAVGLSARPLLLLALWPATDAATAWVNHIITRRVQPHPLPGMQLTGGVPDGLRTLVAVPVLLDSPADLLAQIERLEVHYLSSIGGAVHYALLSDGPDAATEVTPQDAGLIATATAAIDRLNQTYPMPGAPRFLLLHRRRLWNPAGACWMGWERKRGKLAELNRLLRGATDTTFLPGITVPADVRYVITLDADTRLPRDTVRRLIGKLAHPLNRARFDPTMGRVTEGYGILQPRVTPALPVGFDGSWYQRIMSSPGGIEPYAAAMSDVYQDLFAEGSFTGKGIYDVDAFDAALAGRVPENAMLSHDLFEGVFARAALASDTEVIEDFPTRTDVAAKRTHRWVRGDWQLLPWLRTEMPAVGRWKMLDNLRRSLVAPFTLAALVAGWMLPWPDAGIWTLCLLAMMALPRLLGLPLAFLPQRVGVSQRAHFAAFGADIAVALAQFGLSVAFLADQAWLMGDAIARTLWRLFVSRKNLLQWVTAAQVTAGGMPGIAGQVRGMAGGIGLGIGVCALGLLATPANWGLIAPFGLLWALSPVLAWVISRPHRAGPVETLTPAAVQGLRLIARRTWRYFETHVTGADNFLPPDNFQETPRPALARRTSPTNIGLYLLSTVAAHDMGWISQSDALDRLEQTLDRMGTMPRFRGHFYNWYDTSDLRVLDPPYVSSVDSGNLAGHLLAVAQSCREWAEAAPRSALPGLTDMLLLLRAAIGGAANPMLDQLDRAIGAGTDRAELFTLAQTLAATIDRTDPDAAFWADRLLDRLNSPADDPSDPRLSRLAAAATQMAMAMDFSFLLDPDKELLSIGFSVATNALDSSCYDLLASESRLGSLFAIAKGDIRTRHWFRLGRAATPVGAGAALISWSGSMFEYLMPSLVMRAPVGSVLEQTNRLIVARQRAYGHALGLPWGISESSYDARDLEMTYQYSNFGVPGLGLKRGLSQNRVVAPYATGLATMVDPVAAVANFARLDAMGAQGRYGFYEAVDFTPSRLPEGETHAIVRSFMAHHQGMTITAIANTVQDGQLRARFHAIPMVQSVDLLLQERVPRDVATAHPRAEEVAVSAVETTDTPKVRRFDMVQAGAPTAHLLSNGRYGVVLTPTGAGYSRWGDMAITRWRADTAQDALGTFIFMRDADTGQAWSAGVQPTGADPTDHRAVFCEHHAAFTHQSPTLTSLTEVVVSAEDDAEARRVTLTNIGRRSRRIDLTSYAELVLAPQATDLAHPAFSKMFVVTDYLPELGVIIATRRRRSPHEPQVWAAHIAVVEGEETAPVQYETDRAQFIGRGRSIRHAASVATPLSGTTGTVLDPVFSIRRQVRVPAGGRVRVTFWTMVAETPEALLELVDRHRDASAFERAATLAWTQAQVQLRHLGITNAEAVDFQDLAGVILRGDPRLRPSSERIIVGAGPQSGLWPFGISGDLPLILLRIDDGQDMDQVRQILAAHEYWQARQMVVDLVILNERSSSYVQDLQIALETAVRSAQSRPQVTSGQSRGTVHLLRADLVTPEARALLLSAARVVLQASRGSIGQQMDTLTVQGVVTPPVSPVVPSLPVPPVDLPPLEFFNGFGGFADDGRTYVTVLKDGQSTPAPWINVIANPSFGFQVSAEGSGSVWSENSRENLLTPWSNDPVTDPAGEALYLRDLDTGAVWTPTALPVRGIGTYVARHGFGYSQFDHTAHGIAARMVQFVPLADPVRITRLTLTNTTSLPRRLSVTAFSAWVLGTSRSATSGFVTTQMDADTGALLARNPWGIAFPGRVGFADIGPEMTGWTGDRAEVMGMGGSMADPHGLSGALSGRTGAALDPCAALQRVLTLQPGQSVDLRLLLGQAATLEQAQDVIRRYRVADLDAVLAQVTGHWADLLTAVQVKTPDRSMDIMLNGWLLYQTLAARVWARAGFYQASGAYGFRDQLQDGMALTFSRPEMTRGHLLRAAARQFPQGDVQHWWLPHSGQGVRTRISDDRVWLGYGVAHYIGVTGDAAILDEQIPFIEGPQLQPGAHDDFFQPMLSDQTASLFEHCARGIDQGIALTGANGLPLIGTGDWNDGMNRVGEGGQGTSVWLGWLLITTIGMIAPLADPRDPIRAKAWRDHAEKVRQAIEGVAWDGAWYRRGTFDDGTWLGTASADECRIDSIAQSWAVLSGAADPARAAQAMASVDEHLIRPGLALLFTPPFDRTAHDPGYIKGYPPGLRENGGQYSHAAMWAVLAHVRLGHGDRAAALFALLNPINHTLNAQAAERYKGEPYVIAADVYSTAPHEGRAGWTWYTGSAGWMHRAGVEGIIGISRQGDDLLLDPCFPAQWPRVSATVRHGDAVVQIEVDNAAGTGRGIVGVTVDGSTLPHAGGPFRLTMCGAATVHLTLGAT